MLGNLQGWHLIIVLLVVVLIFGASRLPALARSIGQSTKILKDEMRPEKKGEGTAENSSAPSESRTSESRASESRAPSPAAESTTGRSASSDKT